MEWITYSLQLFSEHDSAYSVPGYGLSRGEHFLQEALRLWTIEEGRESLANLQALTLLASVCVCC